MISHSYFGDIEGDFSSHPNIATLAVDKNKNIYVGNQGDNNIKVFSKTGNLIDTLARKGKGPGEFENLIGIVRNSRQIYTSDAANGRFLIFDQHLNLQNAFNRVVNGQSFDGNKSISATDSLFYLTPGSSFSDKLIEVRSTHLPFDSVSAFLPRLIPPDKQPEAYNDYIIDTNKQGNIAVAYNGLPYIFLFDNSLELQHVIYLKLPRNQMSDNPSPKPVVNNSREGVGVTGLISNIALMNNGSINFFKNNKLYELGPQSKDYRLQDVQLFTYGEELEQKDNPYDIRVSNMYIEDSTIYLGSTWEEYIYQFHLN